MKQYLLNVLQKMYYYKLDILLSTNKIIKSSF